MTPTDTVKLRHSTMLHIDDEIEGLAETKKLIEHLKLNIILGSGASDGNVGGGRSNIPGRPTERKGLAITADIRIEQLERLVDAIEYVVGGLPPEKRRFVELRYFARPRIYNTDGIALQLHIAPRTAQRWRREIVTAVALMIGWR